MHTQITSPSLDQGWEMQHGVFPDHHRLPSGDTLVVDRRREISACNGDEGILLKQDLGTGEMDLYNRFMLVIPYQQVGHLGRIAVHRAAGTDAPVTETMSAHILYRIEQTGLNNGESHKYEFKGRADQRLLPKLRLSTTK